MNKRTDISRKVIAQQLPDLSKLQQLQTAVAYNQAGAEKKLAPKPSATGAELNGYLRN
jgi:hypothetical protein